MKEFDDATNVNNRADSQKVTALIMTLRGEAFEVLQMLREDRRQRYKQLVLHLGMKFGDKRLQHARQHVYQAKVKGKVRRCNEILQQYESDIVPLVYLAYPIARSEFIELAVQVFIDGIGDFDIQQALQLARSRKMKEVLAGTLEFKALKQAARGYIRVRKVRIRTPDRRPGWSSGENSNSLKDNKIDKLMEQHGLCLELRECAIKIEQDEIEISSSQSEVNVKRVWLSDDVSSLPEWSKSVSRVNMRGVEEGSQVVKPLKQETMCRKPCPEKCVNFNRAESKEVGQQCQRTTIEKKDNWDVRRFSEVQRNDQDIKPSMAVRVETRPDGKDICARSTTSKGFWAICDTPVLKDGVLRRIWKSSDSKKFCKQLVLPRARVNELPEVPGNVVSLRLEINQAVNEVRERFSWLGRRTDVEDWCQRCAEYVSSRKPTTRREELMQLKSDRLKTRCDPRANTVGFHQGDEVRLYEAVWKKGRLPKPEKT